MRWEAAATDGCVDRYLPTGATLTREAWWPDCDDVTRPQWGEAVEHDAVLAVDRTTAPARFVVRGRGAYSAPYGCASEPPGPAIVVELFQAWPATVTCTRPDGTVTTSTGSGGGRFVELETAFDGTRFAGEYSAEGRRSWHFERL